MAHRAVGGIGRGAPIGASGPPGGMSNAVSNRGADNLSGGFGTETNYIGIGGNQNFGSSQSGFGGGNQTSGSASNYFTSGGGGGGGFGSGGGYVFSGGCNQCGQISHFARECPNAGAGGNRGSGCYKCGQDGHISRYCPNAQSGFGGEDGNAGGFGGGGAGRGDPRTCYKCDQEGHIARNCPNSDGGAGGFGGGSGGFGGGFGSGGFGGGGDDQDRSRGRDRGCYNCGQDGHMWKDCPETRKPRNEGGFSSGGGGFSSGGGFGGGGFSSGNGDEGFGGGGANRKRKCSKLVVLNLLYSFTNDQLQEYFGRYGNVLFSEIKLDRTGRSEGYGFVRYMEYGGEVNVLAQRHWIGGRFCPVRRQVAQDDSQRIINRIYVGGLTENVSTTDLFVFFSQHGPVTNVYIPQPFRNCAFVSFGRPDVAKKLYGENFVIRQCSVHIKPCRPSSSRDELQGCQEAEDSDSDDEEEEGGRPPRCCRSRSRSVDRRDSEDSDSDAGQTGRRNTKGQSRHESGQSKKKSGQDESGDEERGRGSRGRQPRQRASPKEEGELSDSE